MRRQSEHESVNRRNRLLVALTQGDPAGIGPEICVRCAEEWRTASNNADYVPLLVMEPGVLAGLKALLPRAVSGVEFLDCDSDQVRDAATEVATRGLVPALAPQGLSTGGRPPVVFGRPSVADARGAMAAINSGVDLCLDGATDAVVTAPVNKAVIADCVDPEFRGHTDTIAARCATRSGGAEAVYGRDYLMAFKGGNLNVALLSTHVPLVNAIALVTKDRVLDGLRCLDRSLRASGLDGRRIALAGLNPHAGEGGLLGSEEAEILEGAVAQARALGIDVEGPESADTLFLRASGGEFDWVLALYHDQGLIAVKTLGFGGAVNWTAGISVIRTSVDHGTAYPIAGQGIADVEGLLGAVAFAVSLVNR